MTNNFTEEKIKETGKKLTEITGSTEDITMNEHAIILHYEKLLMNQPKLKVKEKDQLKDTCETLEGLVYQLRLLTNHLSLFSAKYRECNKKEDFTLMHYTLFVEGFLNNLNSVLESDSRTLDNAISSLLEIADPL